MHKISNIKNIDTIQYISLKDSKCTNNDIIQILDILKKNKFLRTLDLSKCNIKYILPKITETLYETNLQYLNLHDNNITYNIVDLIDGLKNNNTLTNLNLSKNNLQDDNIYILAEILKNNNTLQKINLSDNFISDNGFTFIINALVNNSSIVSLNLSYNNIIDLILDQYPLLDNFRKNKSLQELRLSHNMLTTDGIIVLSEILKYNSSLLTLDLSINKITANQLNYLTDALKVNKTLTELILTRNLIKDDGFYQIINILKENILKDLWISSNEITDINIKYLCEVLKINSSLRSLDLSFNNLTDISIYYLADILEDNETLEYLDLSNNKITCNALIKMFEALESNSSLKFFGINKVSTINNNLFECVKKTLTLNIALEFLTIDIIDDDINRQINYLLEINKDPFEYQKEFDKKLMNRIIYFEIEWQPNKENHYIFPKFIREKIRYIFILYKAEQQKNLFSYLTYLPIEIWIYILQYLAKSYIYSEIEKKIDLK